MSEPKWVRPYRSWQEIFDDVQREREAKLQVAREKEISQWAIEQRRPDWVNRKPPSPDRLKEVDQEPSILDEMLELLDELEDHPIPGERLADE